MFKVQRNAVIPPSLDLATMRETLSYMHGEMARSPALKPAALALEQAIREIEGVERRSRREALNPRLLTTGRFIRFKH